MSAVIPCETLVVEFLFSAPITRAPDLDKGYYDSFDLMFDDPSSGYDGLDLAPPGFEWVSYMNMTTSVSIDRSVDTRQGIVGRPLAGIMTIDLIDPTLDVMNNPNVSPHTTVRLRCGSDVIFQGEIDRIRSEYDPANGYPTTEIQVVDAVAALNSRRMDPRPAETYGERVKACCDEANLEHFIPTGGEQLLPTDDEYTALEIVKMAADSEAGMVFTDRFNQVQALARGQETPTSRMRLGARQWLCGNVGAGHQCLTGVGTGKNTAETINKLSASNIEWDASDDDPERHRFTRVPYKYDYPESQDFYGVDETYVTTTLTEPQLQEWADYTFARFGNPLAKVTDVTYQTSDFNPDTPIPDIVAVDLGDAVLVRLNDPGGVVRMPDVVSLQTIAGVQHRITPESWDTRLTLLQPEVGYEPPIPETVTYDEFTALFDDVRVTYEGAT